MFVERIQVEEGFLDGLDLELSPHLNVLIGARGTGKTSIIELIRFALGGAAFTEVAGTQAAEQAKSVLGFGQVTVTLRDGEHRIVVARSAGDATPRMTEDFVRPTFVGQREIEAIGAQPRGRLQLLDQFRGDVVEIDDEARTLLSELRSLTSEIASLTEEMGGLSDQAVELSTAPAELDAALRDQGELLATAAVTNSERARLEQLQGELSRLGVEDEALSATVAQLRGFMDSIERVRGTRPRPLWPAVAGGDLLVPVRDALQRVDGHLGAAVQELSSTLAGLVTAQTGSRQRRIAAEQATRELRVRLDSVQAGAAAVSQRVSLLQNRSAQLAANRELIAARGALRETQRETRDRQYAQLDALRERRFLSRARVAATLTEQLGPSIKAEVTRSGDLSNYIGALVTALRGSGLQYNRLATQLATAMSPLELVTAVENADFGAISEIATITPERAATLVAALKASGCAEIIAASIGDSVDLELLDGGIYKQATDMSIGQRCTVVLPILLAAHRDMLVIDQPEDNLDNAFIIDTLVEAMLRRHPSDQLIIASHNANLPVLGNADLVVLLESNGRRGYVAHAGKLADLRTVQAVTAVMEGGWEAFRRRSDFYRSVLES